MAKFDDSITINCSLLEVRDLLADLQRHPSYVPDGFKNYRFLSRETRGQGARAAVQLNLLGHWLGGELEVAEATDQRVVLKAVVEPANLELDFHLVNRGGRTEVRMSSSFQRRMLPPWRLRTRIKQRLRLEQDVAGLVGRFLSLLKSAAEVSPAAAEGSSTAAKATAAKATATRASAEVNVSAAKAGAKTDSSPAKPEARDAKAGAEMNASAKAGTGSSAAKAGAGTNASPAKARASASAAKAEPGSSAEKAGTGGSAGPAKPGAKAASAGATKAATRGTGPEAATGKAKLETRPEAASAPSTTSPAASATDGEYVSAGSEADLGPGQARVIKVGGRDVAVFNIAGEFHAISNSCPHLGGPLGFGTLDGSVVTCPLHGFRFDVTTGQCPDVESLKVPRFELRRANGQLQVRNTPITA